MKKSIKEQLDLITQRGIDPLPPELEAELKKKLATKKPLNVKLGADPSAPDLHLGHSVVLKKLRDFQNLGHKVQFVIGDFTGRVGDPTGKNKARPPLSHEQLRKNAATYKKQIFKILDPKKTQVLSNSEWLDKLAIKDFLTLMARSTLAQLLNRNDFKNRYEKGKPLSLLELCYPILQAYDSVELKTDIELGGTDQMFNLLFTRQLQREYNQQPEIVITVPLLIGLYGKEKMSKSLGNYIGLTDPPHEMYGKVMSLHDNQLENYFTLLTDKSIEDIAAMMQAIKEGANPRDFKMELARAIVGEYYDDEQARASEREFKRIFQEKGIPSKLAELTLPQDKITTLTGLELLQLTALFKSKSEARRLIKGKGVRLDGKPLADEPISLSIKEGAILKVGKRQFFRLRVTAKS